MYKLVKLYIDNFQIKRSKKNKINIYIKMNSSNKLLTIDCTLLQLFGITNLITSIIIIIFHSVILFNYFYDKRWNAL